MAADPGATEMSNWHTLNVVPGAGFPSVTNAPMSVAVVGTACALMAQSRIMVGGWSAGSISVNTASAKQAITRSFI
jgi:hypothetical protein